MAFRGWLRISAENIRENGLEGLGDVLHELYLGLWFPGWLVPRGTNVYEKDWDVLVILDACRVDLMESVTQEYDFIDDVESVSSVGSMSKEWMAKTFTDEYADEVAETAYVTGNAFSEQGLSVKNFDCLEEVWKYGWDDKEGTVPPREMTDAALRVWEKESPERMIIHYVQPHHPFLGIDRFEAVPFGADTKDTVVDALRKGKIDRDEFWSAYRKNLCAVLEDVELLLSNLDAEKVVLTSDHGDALGEWGIYDHPVGCLHPSVRKVPWVETEAKDTGEYEPAPLTEEKETTPVEDQLRALGYTA